MVIGDAICGRHVAAPGHGQPLSCNLPVLLRFQWDAYSSDPILDAQARRQAAEAAERRSISQPRSVPGPGRSPARRAEAPGASRGGPSSYTEETACAGRVATDHGHFCVVCMVVCAVHGWAMVL